MNPFPLPLAHTLLIFSSVIASLTAAEPAQVFSLDRVRLLDGPFKQIQELHRTGMVGALEPDRLLFQFRKNAGLPQPAGVTSGYGGWDDNFIAGHYGGHYLSAAARMFAATGDASFKQKADSMVKVLAECQEKLGGGYLSAFPAEKFSSLEAAPRAASVEYYTIHKILAGLVDVADLCKNDQAYQVASRMSDYFAGRIAKLTPQQLEAMLRTDYTGNPVNEFGGMAEALADLYALSKAKGDPDAGRHIELSRIFIRDWFVDPLCRGENKLDGLHGNTHVAQASGIARHAVLTGSEREAKAARQFWEFVTHEHSFVNGSNSFHEKLRTPGTEVAGSGVAAISPLTSESCNTHNMLKLTRHLGEIEPSAELADYYENALYNHLLSTIAPDHGKVTYYLSMRPGDYRVHVPDPVCCQGTGIEHAARFGEAIYSHREDSLWVNLFIASTLDWKETGIQLRLETSYPEHGAVRITLQSAQARNAAIHLRIPAWLDQAARIQVNGQAAPDGKPGTFAKIERVWKSGDTIELTLPLKLRSRTARDHPAVVSFFHGPVLLAGALGREGMPASDIDNHMALSETPPWPVPVLVTNHPAAPDFKPVPVDGQPLNYELTLTHPLGRKQSTIRLAPFYQVHHQRFALYWKALTPEQFDAYATEIQESRDSRTSFIGDPEQEKALNFQGGKTSTGSFQNRKWRDASQGGWFSYRMALPAEKNVNLVCTYWGGETGNRNFDILVEGSKVAEQTLNNNEPGKFFDATYPLPDALIHGRQFITIRFQARPGSQAGGLFHLRLVPRTP